jgi:hypothetical protein
MPEHHAVIAADTGRAARLTGGHALKHAGLLRR